MLGLNPHGCYATTRGVWDALLSHQEATSPAMSVSNERLTPPSGAQRLRNAAPLRTSCKLWLRIG